MRLYGELHLSSLRKFFPHRAYMEARYGLECNYAKIDKAIAEGENFEPVEEQSIDTQSLRPLFAVMNGKQILPKREICSVCKEYYVFEHEPGVDALFVEYVCGNCSEDYRGEP